MEKKELLNELKLKIDSNEISIQEVLELVKPNEEKLNANKIFSVLGGVIIFIGISTLIGLLWEEANSLTRILLTLGIGILLTALSIFFNKEKKQDLLSLIFSIIGGLYLPTGVIVTIFEIRQGEISELDIVLIAFLLLGIYGAFALLFKKSVYIFFAIVHGTSFIYSIINFIFSSDYSSDAFRTAIDWVTIILGLGYIFISYYWKKLLHPSVQGMLRFFGSIMVYGIIGSHLEDGLLIWDLLFVIATFGGIYISTLLESRTLLVTSNIAFVSYLVYLSGKYFANAIGWPITLIIIGFLLIGVGYGFVKLNNVIGKKPDSNNK